MGELFPPSLVINALAAKPGFGKVCWLQVLGGDRLLETLIWSQMLVGVMDPLGL